MDEKINDEFVKNLDEGISPMLEQTTWIRVNKQCHTLVDKNFKIVAVICTSYDENDGDENLIWDVEIEGEEFGSFISLYGAKLAVQETIAQIDAEVEKEKQKKKRLAKKKKEEKKVNVRK